MFGRIRTIWTAPSRWGNRLVALALLFCVLLIYRVGFAVPRPIVKAAEQHRIAMQNDANVQSRTPAPRSSNISPAGKDAR